MGEIAINIKAVNQPGVLRDITELTAQCQINITYTHMFIEDKYHASLYMELEAVENVEKLMANIGKLEAVSNVEECPTLQDVFGKRIIILVVGHRWPWWPREP